MPVNENAHQKAGVFYSIFLRSADFRQTRQRLFDFGFFFFA